MILLLTQFVGIVEFLVTDRVRSKLCFSRRNSQRNHLWVFFWTINACRLVRQVDRGFFLARERILYLYLSRTFAILIQR